MTTIKLTLPWPPSINSMYAQGIIGAKRNLEGPLVEVLRRLSEDHKAATIDDVLTFARTDALQLRALVKSAFGSPRASMFLSDAGKEYRELARTAIQLQDVPRGALTGRLSVSVLACPPDARARDLDNLWKSALDVLKHNKVIADDSHFDRELIERGPIRKGGHFALELSEIREAFESRQQGFDLAPPPIPARSPAPF